MSTHAHIEGSNKKIALLIAVFAALLALAETAGKSAQTAALSHNIEASNLWAFFQAKTIRMTTLRTATEALEVERHTAPNPGIREEIDKRIAGWRATAARYDSEPETREGRKELAERAKQAEGRRDHSLAAYHHFELASAAFQIAIVLASASVITEIALLAWAAAALGLVGAGFSAVGFLAPAAIHVF